jgi:V-type H+-transporting ATPase subunit a
VCLQLNPELTPFQRRYVSNVKRCDELERKLRFFKQEIGKFDLEMDAVGSIDSFLNTPTVVSGSGDASERSGAQLLIRLENELGNYETQLRELNSFNEKLTTEYNEKVELQEVLDKARRFFIIDAPRFAAAERSTMEVPNDDEQGLLESRPDLDMRFSSITGVISNEEKSRFERMIFRATRGNVFVRFVNIQQPITDPRSGLLIEKSVFIIFYKSDVIGAKLQRICTAFSANRYSLPDMDDSTRLDHMLTENSQELVDSRTVLLKNQAARFRMCQLLVQHTERWTWIVLKEKAVYHSLNMFKADVSGILRGEAWVIAEERDEVRRVVEQAHANVCMTMPSFVDYVPRPWPTPPTHFVTNKFTYGYQEFVNTYGIPRYREANPALFTAATFPFLFGVMYGDIGHGLFLLCAGLFLLSKEKENENAKLGEMAEGLHAGRYMIVMMGFFAVYAGFIYNDCFSLGLNFFGSRWEFENQEYGSIAEGATATNIATYGSDESVYIFGLDPIWHVSTNELLFFNSFKMKLSVIFGILQMFMGTCLHGLNSIYFGERLDFLFEFLPMVVFAASLFIYMVFLIFYKWSVDWNSRMLSATCVNPNGDGWGSTNYNGEWITCQSSDGEYCTPWGYVCQDGDDTAAKCPLNYGGSGDGCQPPNLITTLINIALQPGAVDEPMFYGQAGIQNILLLCAFGSVPVLLIAKPFFLSQKQHQYQPVTHHGEDDDHDHADHKQEPFAEILIHQAIETIEFVLGMISNTASYLRLWALSLAHTELATVFWEKAMLSTLNMNWFAAYIGFAVFAGVTLGVLLMMDVLECFLHSLRLHWVEFQGKFFKADGVRFTPYSFKQLIKDSA